MFDLTYSTSFFLLPLFLCIIQLYNYSTFSKKICDWKAYLFVCDCQHHLSARHWSVADAVGMWISWRDGWIKIKCVYFSMLRNDMFVFLSNMLRNHLSVSYMYDMCAKRLALWKQKQWNDVCSCNLFSKFLLPYIKIAKNFYKGHRNLYETQAKKENVSSCFNTAPPN